MIQEYCSARDLPPEWDAAPGDNLYMRRNFLIFLEDVSDVSGERYYAFRGAQGEIDSRLMLYHRDNHPLTMFSRFMIKTRTGFVYVPLSVARPGAVLGDDTRAEVFRFFRGLKGMNLFYNMPEAFRSSGTIPVKTCPRCVLDVRWKSFAEYLEAMRSGYRRRYHQALKKSAPLRMHMLADNRDFSPELYELYLEVFNAARFKLEKLSLEFFRGAFFKILVLEDERGQAQGFVQLLENRSELIFEFVGFRYATNRKYDTYIRLLLEIVRYGIENGFESIDFGQTADEAKLKLGCRYEHLNVMAHHSNPLLNLLIRATLPLLQYQPMDDAAFHVFRGE